MKQTIVKAIAFTAIMISGLQAQAALTACAVTKESSKGNYTKVLYSEVQDLMPDGNPQIFSDELGVLSVAGYNFSVANIDGNLSLTTYKMSENEETEVAGVAFATGASTLTLILPKLKIAVSCSIHNK